MDITKSEAFKNFTILNMALLFLIELNKTVVQSVPKCNLSLKIVKICRPWFTKIVFKKLSVLVLDLHRFRLGLESVCPRNVGLWASIFLVLGFKGCVLDSTFAHNIIWWGIIAKARYICLLGYFLSSGSFYNDSFWLMTMTSELDLFKSFRFPRKKILWNNNLSKICHLGSFQTIADSDKFQSNQIFHYTRYITAKCVTS